GLITGYPGSPVADFFNVAGAVKDLLIEKGVLVQIANNEALGAARVNGSQMENVRAIVAMKSVGAHVASDGLALGNLSKTSKKGGALVLIGDDPWSDSTQVPSDSRYLAKHLHIPVLEPSTFQEMKDWVRLGLNLSQESDLYLAYLVTTNLADGGGTVEVYENRFPLINTKNRVTIDTHTIPTEKTVVLSPRTAEREETLAERYERLIGMARKLDINKIIRKGARKPVGFITSGLAYFYLEHVLEALKVTSQIPILKFGITFPLDRDLLLEFAKSVDSIVVIEEKRDFLESQVVTILKDEYQNGNLNYQTEVWGKNFPAGLPGIPATRGLNPSILMERIGNLLLNQYQTSIYFEPEEITQNLSVANDTGSVRLTVPQRTPTFCPGCPHRDSSSVLLEIKKRFRDPNYMKKEFKRQPVDLLFHGDTGCYTMLMFEPNQELMHNYSGMGLGGGTGAGIDPFITNKQIVFMGDSTFFHSGMIAISDAVKHSQDITFIILDNGTIAMTGHQPTPAVGEDIMGNETVVQSIDRIVQGMLGGTGAQAIRVNPAYREHYRELLEETILKNGVKVVIADKECGITYDRKIARKERAIIKKEGFLPEKRFVNLSPDVCEFCLECTIATGCPGLTLIETNFGKKLATDLSWCKADGACAKIEACPSFGEVTVIRKTKPISPFERLKSIHYPEPNIQSFSKTWNAYVAGVGGMGIGVITAVLVQAGFKEGYQIRFLDKKGLAIRNGGVYSHIHFLKEESFASPLTSYGETDLLLGLDPLEAVRSIDASGYMRIANPNRTVALINRHKTPTIAMLTGKEDFDIACLESFLKQRTKEEFYYSEDLSHLSEEFFGSKLFSNLMMLGIAYQKGLLPVHSESLRWAIQHSVPVSSLKENLQAFDLGRHLVVMSHDLFPDKKEAHTYEALLEQKSEILERSPWLGYQRAKRYRRLVRSSISKMRLDESAKFDFTLRVYQMIQYENFKWAEKFVSLVMALHEQDSAEFGYEATHIAIQNLFKVIAIKDEIYVAELLTSEEEKNRNYQRYQIHPDRGDQLKVRFLNKPEFILFW
ncbi:MAG: 2-oxoacid:acceptor oxidoreductase family protein, partial [Candidatus Omnitrophica bacterium]|nr:2-oxoacid:acceptor oxidoreductase family protein [Candidatus Omnitrophota bacterium]